MWVEITDSESFYLLFNLFFNLCLFLVLPLIFNYMINFFALQCSVSFCCTMKWISFMDTDQSFWPKEHLLSLAFSKADVNANLTPGMSRWHVTYYSWACHSRVNLNCPPRFFFFFFFGNQDLISYQPLWAQNSYLVFFGSIACQCLKL